MLQLVEICKHDYYANTSLNIIILYSNGTKAKHLKNWDHYSTDNHSVNIDTDDFIQTNILRTLPTPLAEIGCINKAF